MGILPQERGLVSAAKDKIGSFYLKTLITPPNNPLQMYYAGWASLQSMKEDLLKEKVTIPNNVLSLFNIQKYHWQQAGRFDGTKLPILFLNYREDMHSPSLQDAIMTIEVSKRTVGRQLQPMHLRLGGVFDNRIIGLKYDYDSGKLVETNVSVSEKELPSATEKRYLQFDASHHALNEQDTLTTAIPSDITNPYSLAGLITKGMVAKTATNPDDEHQRALVIKPSNYVPGFSIGNNTEKESEIQLNILAEEFGFRAIEDEGKLYVSFRPQRNGPLAWSIIIPTSFQKAA